MNVLHIAPFGIFEWDSNKNELNIKKHGIDFADAIEVFSDDRAVIRYDMAHSENEERYRAVGMLRNVLIATVVFTDRDKVTRIISARRATMEEAMDYEQNIKN